MILHGYAMMPPMGNTMTDQEFEASDGLPAHVMSNLPLPGMAAIALWMLALALVGVAGVLTGHYPRGAARVGILILCSVFAAGRAGTYSHAAMGMGAYPRRGLLLRVLLVL